jgi:predicted alpha/beta superfamily hydrolase
MVFAVHDALLWYSERTQPPAGCVRALTDSPEPILTDAAPASTSGCALPFEGAALRDCLVPEPAPETEGAALHPEVDSLDLSPRFRRIRGFQSAHLPGERDVLVYLPEAYLREPARRFPVFYLHDGQNLMDGRTSYVPGRTWQAHTTADRLTGSGEVEPLILVGIDHMGTRRMDEYTPTRDPGLGGGEGPQYGRMLTEELKPLIDNSLHTLPDAPNTALGGSSLGGLISLALGMKYADIFAKLAIMSPSIWWNNRSILQMVSAGPVPRPSSRLWLDMGTAEGLRHLRDCDLLDRRLLARGWREGTTLRYLRVPGGMHNEDAWATRFDEVLRFLFPAR